jgi:hypothetical protein
VTDRYHSGFFSKIELDDSARSIVSQARNDDAVARLKPSSGLAELKVAMGLALEVRKPLIEHFARALSLCPGGMSRLPCFLGLTA